jgi:hypothetical protein
MRKKGDHQNEWAAMCVYVKNLQDYWVVAMFENPYLAARLMGGKKKKFSRVGIRNAVTNKNNKSGTSSIINLNDVCNWRFVKKV